MIVGIALVAAVVLLAVLVVVRRRQPRNLEAEVLSDYHAGLDALSRLDERHR